MQNVLIWIVTLIGPSAFAADHLKFNYKDAEITEVIQDYAKASGQKFVVADTVKGKVNIFNPKPVSREEAYNQLSSTLALNGLAISEQGDTRIVTSARNTQRSLIGVGAELPPLKPEKMFTWVVKLRHADAAQVMREIRTLSSRDGEIVAQNGVNQLFITDWVSNLYRVREMMSAIDAPDAHPKPRSPRPGP